MVGFVATLAAVAGREIAIPDKPRRRLLQQPPELVQRWVRQKIFRSIPAIVRWKSRGRLSRAERERRKALIDAFNEIKDQAIRAEGSSFEARNTVLNLALFFLLAERDISCLKIDALTHPDEWTRKLYARVIILIIYELDLDKVS